LWLRRRVWFFGFLKDRDEGKRKCQGEEEGWSGWLWTDVRNLGHSMFMVGMYVQNSQYAWSLYL
jgi:hypothetical protein